MLLNLTSVIRRVVTVIVVTRCHTIYTSLFISDNLTSLHLSLSVKNIVGKNHCSLVLSLYAISYPSSLSSLHSFSCSPSSIFHQLPSLSPSPLPLAPYLSLTYVCRHDCCVVNWMQFNCVRMSKDVLQDWDTLLSIVLNIACTRMATLISLHESIYQSRKLRAEVVWSKYCNYPSLSKTPEFLLQWEVL